MLHSVVPDVESQPDGADAQAEDGEPLDGPRRNDGRFERGMTDRRQSGGREAEARDRLGRRARERTRQHRIAGPDKRATEGEGVADLRLPSRFGEARAFREKERRRAGKAERRADQVASAQTLARQGCGEKHDQQRPEIGDQARICRGRAAKRREVERVITEQAADSHRPHFGRLAERREPPARRCIAEPAKAADSEGERRQFERRRLPRKRRHERERRPQRDRPEPDQRGGEGGRSDRRRRHGSRCYQGTAAVGSVGGTGRPMIAAANSVVNINKLSC